VLATIFSFSVISPRLLHSGLALLPALGGILFCTLAG